MTDIDYLKIPGVLCVRKVEGVDIVREWKPLPHQFERWVEVYPNIDVLDRLRAASAWSRKKRSQLKAERYMSNWFVSTWLHKRAESLTRSPPTASKRKPGAFKQEQVIAPEHVDLMQLRFLSDENRAKLEALKESLQASSEPREKLFTQELPKPWECDHSFERVGDLDICKHCEIWLSQLVQEFDDADAPPLSVYSREFDEQLS